MVSMMPHGVEHIEQMKDFMQVAWMELAMMPNGVEHEGQEELSLSCMSWNLR